MKKYIILLLLFGLIGSGMVMAEKLKKQVVILPEILKPKKILSDDQQFYIIEAVTVYIYQWDGFRFLKKIGSRGEGPQEYNIDRTGGIGFTIHPDRLLAYTPTKVLEYKKDGTYIREYRLRDLKQEGFTGAIYKLGNFYVHNDLPIETKDIFDTKIIVCYLCDSKLNKIKELGRAHFSVNLRTGIEDIFDKFITIELYKEMAFVSGGNNFEITGVNDAGKIFLNLKYNYNRLKVTQDDINAYHYYFKTQHPNRARYEIRKSKWRFPEYFPAIKRFKVANDMIYVQTYRKNKNQVTEFLIFDLKGKYLRTVYIPVEAENLENDYPYLFKDGQFIQLIENLDEESWYLHITPIK